MDAIRLGGNIELYGADAIDRASMVVLKKIIGTYVRKFSDKGLERLAVSFAGQKISVEAVAHGSTHASDAEHSNLFFAIDAVLKDIEQKLS